MALLWPPLAFLMACYSVSAKKSQALVRTVMAYPTQDQYVVNVLWESMGHLLHHVPSGYRRRSRGVQSGDEVDNGARPK